MGPIAKAVTKTINKWEYDCPTLMDGYQGSIHEAYRTYEANPPEIMDQYLMHECMRWGKTAFHGVSFAEQLEVVQEVKGI